MNDESREQPPKTTADQRKNLRSPLLVVKVRIDDGSRTFFGYTKNISRSGLFIGTVNPREPGSRFQVEIPLPHPLEQQVQCSCEVVWQRQYRKSSPYEPGMGLRFVDLPSETAEAIERWVKQND